MTEHFCQIHNYKFYKNEKDGKTWYSHKIKGGTGYCNEPKGELEQQSKPPPKAIESKTSPVEEVNSSKPPTKDEQMTKGDWAEKDKATRKSIERQKSLEMAVGVAKIKASDSTEKIIATAKLFEAYLEGIKSKEVQPVKKNRLVEEAQRLDEEGMS